MNQRQRSTRLKRSGGWLIGAAQRGLLCVLAGLMLLGVSADAGAQAIKAEQATQADGAVLQNDRSRQHMLELEQRMFRLAEMLQANQPEDAQRLIMGVQRSRDQLLVERMSSVSQLIKGVELSEASKQVDGVIAELRIIKKLMLTADLELALKREQLRKINEALKDLDAIAEQEAKNQAQSDKLAAGEGEGEGEGEGQGEGEGEAKSAAAMKALAEAEARNREATDRLAEKVGEINPQDGDLQSAQGALGEASGSMGQASDQLAQGQSPSGASQSQGEARKQLDDAKKKLEEAKQKLQKQIERKIRELVVDNLRAMLKQQTEIREQLELVAESADQGDERSIIQIKGLAPPEQEIVVLAADTIDLCEQTEFSIAMPAALSAVRGKMVYLTEDYAKGRGGQRIVKTTRGVEEDLIALIDAMELSNMNQDPSDPPPPQQQNPRDQEQREINQILAELRMLRIMQAATNEAVVRVERDRQSGDVPESQLREREVQVRDQQEKVRDATAKLRQQAMQGGG